MFYLVSLLPSISNIFIALPLLHIKNSKDIENSRKIKKEMPDGIQPIYIQAAGPILVKDRQQMQTEPCTPET